MALSLGSSATALNLAMSMWSTPGLEGPIFTSKAYMQILSGAVDLLPGDNELASAKLLAVTRDPEHPDVFNLQALERAFELVRKAQGMKENFTLVNFEHPQFLDNSTNALRFEHFGIPRAHADLFVELMNACPIRENQTLDRQTAYNYWYNQRQPKCPNYAFDSIWKLLHQSTPGDAPEINRDGFFVIMYLSVMLHFDMLIPEIIPTEILGTLIAWRNAAVPPEPRASLEAHDVVQGDPSKGKGREVPRTPHSTPVNRIHARFDDLLRGNSNSPSVSSDDGVLSNPFISPAGSARASPSKANPFSSSKSPNTGIIETDIPLRSPLQERMKAQKGASMSTSPAGPTTVTPPAVPSVDIHMQNQTPQATPTGPANDTTGTQATTVPDIPDAATATGVLPGATITLNRMNMAQMSAALVADLSKVFVRKTPETAPPVAGKVNPPKPEGKKRVDAIVRSLMEELLKWKRKENKGALPPLPPTPAAVTKFDQGKSCGPTSDEFSIAWGASAYTGWNLAASRIFTDEFIKRQNAGKYQHKNLPEELLEVNKITILFRKKLRYYTNVRTQLLIQLQGTKEQQTLLYIQTEQRHKYARRRSRHQDSLDIRLGTVKRHPEWSPEWGKVVEELGVAGMSLDETDSEYKRQPPRFYRIPKPWRSTHITMLLCVIDRAYRKSSPLGNQPGRTGNLRRLRMGNHPTKIHDTPKPDYPSTFYDQDFLRKERPGSLQLLQATNGWNKPFPLPTIFSTALSDDADDWNPTGSTDNQAAGPSN